MVEENEIIESGPKFIHRDGDKFAFLVEKFPGFAKELTKLLEEKEYYYRDKPFKYPKKRINLEKIKDYIDLINPNPIKEQPEEKAKEKNPYQIFTIEGQVKNFYDNQPFFYDSAKLFHLWDSEEYKWEMCDDIDILNKMKENIPQVDTISSKARAEIINALKQIGRKKKPKDMPKTWIQFKDKIVDVISGEEFTATPEYYTTNPIPWKLGGSTDTPTIDRLIHEWVVDGVTQDKSYVKTMKQIIAYVCSSEQFLQRMISLCGGGMNGKGTYMKMLTKFVGIENCCSSDLRILATSNFEASALYKKLLCEMGEVDSTDLKNTNTIKKLSGENEMRYEFKGKGSFSDTSPTTCIISTNSMPTTPDKSLGFYRRWLIVDFPHQFSIKRDLIGQIPDEEFENLGRCILGLLKEMYKESQFDNEGSMVERQDRYEERSNPIMRFIETECEEDFAKKIELKKFCGLFNEYLKVRHLRIMSPIQIGKILRNEGFEISTRKIQLDFHQVSAKFIICLGLKASKTTETTQISTQNACEGVTEHSSGSSGFGGGE